MLFGFAERPFSSKMGSPPPSSGCAWARLRALVIFCMWLSMG